MNTRELFVLLAMCAVWGLHFIVIKTAVGAVPPILYAAMRMWLVALILIPFLRWRRGQMIIVLSAGVCFGAFNYAFMFTGISLASASASAIAAELYTPFATILSILFLAEKVGWRRILGIALAFLGVAIIALGREGGGEAGRIGIGVGLVAVGTLMEATGSILVKRARGFKPQELLAWFALIGAVVLAMLSFALENGQAAAIAASDHWLLAGAIVYSAVGASLFGHTAYYWLLQRLPVSQVAPAALLTTLLAVIFSVAILGDPLTWRLVVGGLMAMSGVGIVLLRTPKNRIVEPGAPEAVVIEPPTPAPRAAEESR